MKMFTFAASALAALHFCAEAPAQQEAAPSLSDRRPNLILIIADDVSATDIGCYGNETVRTPNLDRMAANGQRWTRAYLTASVCSPSRCSMITGRYPHNTGAPELHTVMREDQPLFPLELKKAGYWTAQSGKWHLGPAPVKAFDLTVQDGKKIGESGCEYWIPLLKERPRDKPFFLWLASYDAHRAWQPDPEGKPHDPDTVIVPEPMVDTPATRKDLAGYYDEIQRLDRYVGKVVAELKNQNILDNTMILFVSDNGRPFPRAKRWITEEGSRTPWIVHWPDGIGRSPKTCTELVSTIDIAPTFLELAGAKTPAAVQGISFSRQLTNPKARICDYVFAERNWQVEYCHERMLRFGNWAYYRNQAPELAHFGYVCATYEKYRFPGYADLWNHVQAGKPLTEMQKTVFLQPRPEEQLFNLAKDPKEIHDLANRPEHKEILARLRNVMDQWMAETGDTAPDKASRTPDRHDRVTGKRLFKGMHPGPEKFKGPGQSTAAAKIEKAGPR